MVKTKRQKSFKRKVVKTFALISVGALTLLAIAVGILLWRFVTKALNLVVIISAGVLLVSLIIGGITWKKIKKKIIDIFT